MTLNYPQFEADGAIHETTTAPIPRKGIYRTVAKRLLDIALILLATPFVLPVVLLLAFAVSRDGGSAFYTQERIGRGGRIFRMWKLRSMVPNADDHLERHLAANPDARAEWNSTQKLRNDPRITPLGRLLRKTSLDELPQLWNVFIGQMSLVGPRPMMVSQKGMYPGKAYYLMRPGVTGLWQTAGRHKTTFAARADFDTQYARDLSFLNDLRILWRTVAVVLRGTGC
ncbi:sugar transferase [Cereibacter sp. SYSU M97828]|nr:sugar transferase [Cereibacter flavus]